MYHFFSQSKSVNNLKILVLPSNNLSSMFLTSSFNLFISFILSVANTLNYLSFLMKSYSQGFSKSSHFSRK